MQRHNYQEVRVRLFLTIERATVQPLNVDDARPVRIDWQISNGPNRDTVVAMADGRKIGSYVWVPHERALYELYVPPGDLRRKGIGQRLIEHAIAYYGAPIYLTARPFSRVPGEPKIDVASLRRFYERNGFVPYPQKGEDWLIFPENA